MAAHHVPLTVDGNRVTKIGPRIHISALDNLALLACELPEHELPRLDEARSQIKALEQAARSMLAALQLIMRTPDAAVAMARRHPLGTLGGPSLYQQTEAAIAQAQAAGIKPQEG